MLVAKKKIFLVSPVMSLNIKETKYVQCYQRTVHYREEGCIGLYIPDFALVKSFGRQGYTTQY